MDSLEKLPDAKISPSGKICERFLDLGVETFKEACDYVYKLVYGYNSDYDDEMILFKEKKGTCTTKHATIAGLAEELSIPLYKNVGVYKFTEEISSGTNKILEKYDIPYVPMAHCFLAYKDFQFDLTEGNNNGKKKNPQEFIHIEQVEPFISRKKEYLLYKKVLKEKVLSSEEMKGIKEKTILKAREEAIKLLKKNIK